MTPSDRELIDWLATNVMGWHAVFLDEHWIDADGECAARDWNPLTSHDDAAMLEAKVRERGAAFERSVAKHLYIGLGPSDTHVSGAASDLECGLVIARRAKPRQICKAIKAAWEGIGNCD